VAEFPVDLSLWTAAQIVRELAIAPEDRVSVLLAELVRRFEPLIRRTWRRLGGDAADYDDFRQEALLKLFRTLPQLQDPAAFPGFFRRLIVNTAYDELRRSARQSRHVVPMESELEFAVEEADVLGDIDDAILIRSHLEALPPREREVLLLEYMEGLSVLDIARRWGISRGAVRMTKSRAINKLQSILASEENTARKIERDT
jgi:RNA polymerase sigma-70 factor (ECF subfamily)